MQGGLHTSGTRCCFNWAMVAARPVAPWPLACGRPPTVPPEPPPSSGLQVVEKFTAHYVFALGLSRFISCAHWILQVCCPALPCTAVGWGMVVSGPASVASSCVGCCSSAVHRCSSRSCPCPALALPPPRSWTVTSTCGRRWAAGCGPSWCWCRRLCRWGWLAGWLGS